MISDPDQRPPGGRPRMPRVTVDLDALRGSRELRMLVLGNFVSGLGTQAALVAIPYQVYVQTRSALLTGLARHRRAPAARDDGVLGGALADRADRRRLLLVYQVALVAVAAALCAAALAAKPPIVLLYAQLPGDGRRRAWTVAATSPGQPGAAVGLLARRHERPAAG